MAILQQITLFTAKYGTTPKIYAVEGDTDRDLVAEIGDLTLTGTMTAKLWYFRPDGVRDSVNGTIDTVANTVTAQIDNAITEEGRVFCQAKITASGNVVSTYTFHIIVQKEV